MHIVEYLFDAGPCMPGAMGPVPLTHGELRAWQENTGIELRPFEATWLRRLSIEYVAQAQESTDPLCPPPFDELRARREAVARKLDEVLG